MFDDGTFGSFLFDHLWPSFVATIFGLGFVWAGGMGVVAFVRSFRDDALFRQSPLKLVGYGAVTLWWVAMFGGTGAAVLFIGVPQMWSDGRSTGGGIGEGIYYDNQYED